MMKPYVTFHDQSARYDSTVGKVHNTTILHLHYQYQLGSRGPGFETPRSRLISLSKKTLKPTAPLHTGVSGYQ